jgi:Trm5-related predicted tRNA methylase
LPELVHSSAIGTYLSSVKGLIKNSCVYVKGVREMLSVGFAKRTENEHCHHSVFKIYRKKCPNHIQPVLENKASAANDHKLVRKSFKDMGVEAKENYLKACSTNFGIIIDCNWEKEHSDNTIKSLAHQIVLSYGINRKHSHPAQLHLTGLGPRVTKRLKSVLFDNWVGVTKSSEDYLDNTTDFSIEPVDSSSVSSAKQLVYLTSDADETLHTLDTNCMYIIGGIVDRNQLKGATYNKATQQGVRTARLPIKEHFAMAPCSTHILTVNHVYEILLNYAQDENWTSAIERVIPKRKKKGQENL